MRTHRRIISIATCGLLLISLSAARFVAGSHTPPSARTAPAPCTLITTEDATTALEAPSQPGEEFIVQIRGHFSADSHWTGCIWSNDPDASDSSRRVTLNMHSLGSFQFAKNPAITTTKIESVSGIGDEAFYEIYPKDQSPIIWVRKGNTAFYIRILTQLEHRPFTIEQEKSKEAVLAKAAVTRL